MGSWRLRKASTTYYLEQHLGWRGIAIEVQPGLAPPKKKVDVEMITLNDVLAREGFDKIDFLSMDIEKGEPPALRGFDIQRFRLALVCVEAEVEEVRVALTEYFAANGYERVDAYARYDMRNWYYRPKPEAIQADAE